MDLPFTTDYAKSNQAVCRGCQNKIIKNTLRIAIMLQATAFDGKAPNWYHSQCFFIEHMPHSVAEIENYDSLKWADKQDIKDIIANGESPFSSQEGKEQLKRSIALAASKAAKENYSVVYAKNALTKCDKCGIKINKDDIRIMKKTTKKKLWHHLACFAKIHESLDYLECGSELVGFDKLKEEDQDKIKIELPGVTEVPMKKKRLSSEDSAELSLSQEERTAMEHSNIMHTYRDQLKANLTKEELAKLLRHNKQAVPSGLDNLLDRASEMLTFGALARCSYCFRGQLTYTNAGYKCTGLMGPWSKCNAITEDPLRHAVHIPKNLQLKHTCLYNYEYVPRKRSTKQYNTAKEKGVCDGPLKWKNLVVSGFSEEESATVRQEVKALGGRVVSEIRRSVLAVVAASAAHGAGLEQAREYEVYVVARDFLTELRSAGIDPDLDALARKHSLCEWGAELHNRVPAHLKRGGTAIGGGSWRRGLEEEEGGKRRMCVKNGVAIEPGTGLEDKAHVYQSAAVVYNAVLSLADLSINKNSFYKIQLLESDALDEYWVFRKWGRTGTTVGGTKLDKYDTLPEAKVAFKGLYAEKSGNTWENRHCFVKKAGKFVHVEVNYQAQKEEIEDLNTRVADSSLAPAVAQLMAMIFNVQSMEKMMLEYELDTQKMPLGKLSRAQIKEAYSVLNQVQWALAARASSDELLALSNQFYSLMPHNAALRRPAPLASREAVRTKCEMLASLLEMETAYSIMQQGARGESGNPLDAYYRQLCADVEPVAAGSEEHRLVCEYVASTHADTHRHYDLRVLELFRVRRSHEDARFAPWAALHNRQLLWHGSRTTNFAGILSQGLRIAPPEAPVTGYMFGKGIYFADMVSKSANYCCTTAADREGLVLLCEVALGTPAERTAHDYAPRLPPNVHSVKGVGRTQPDPAAARTLPDGLTVPLGRPRPDPAAANSTLLYNEYIVYDEAQVRIKYLLKMDFQYKTTVS